MSRHVDVHEPCYGCNRPMTKHGEPRQPGLVRHDSHGHCGMCANRRRRGSTTRAYTRGDTTYLLTDGDDTPVCGRENAQAEWWFPDDTLGVRHAIWLCNQCPVLEACREDVLTTTVTNYGVAGGLSRDERNKLRALRRKEAA